MSERVIALDPGGRSGWASAVMSTDRLEFVGSGVLRQDLMARQLAKWQGVIGPAGRRHPVIEAEYAVIVNESWRPRRINGTMDWIEGDPLLSAQHVGQIRLIADLSAARYVEQAPSQKNVYRANFPAKLESLNEFSSEMHDQDARLHLWGYFFDQWFTASKSPEECVYV